MSRKSKTKTIAGVHGNHIGSVARMLERKLNESAGHVAWKVEKSGHGQLTVTCLDNGNSRIIYPHHTRHEIGCKKPIGWNDSYKIDKEGRVYNAAGEFIARAKIYPLECNSHTTRRLYDGTFTYSTNEVQFSEFQNDDQWDDFIHSFM